MYLLLLLRLRLLPLLLLSLTLYKIVIFFPLPSFCIWLTVDLRLLYPQILKNTNCFHQIKILFGCSHSSFTLPQISFETRVNTCVWLCVHVYDLRNYRDLVTVVMRNVPYDKWGVKCENDSKSARTHTHSTRIMYKGDTNSKWNNIR